MTLLEHIRGPEDLHGLATHELSRLSAEIRRRLVETVSRNGGHLGPNLGVVELTIALHRVFSSPRDHIVFDTGHQSYVHKMLTGRAGDFTRLRERNGLSGYPSRAESAHDVTENSHASTALSYADGLAKAYQLRGETDRAVVAVVGDGAFTGGMCWEALNNIGAAPDRPIIVVLNDNGRSYAPTVGGFAAHLTALRTGRCGTLFEAVGVDYLGPVNGHDVTAVEHALRKARRVNRPVLVHCVTTKGRGHPPAEADEADCLHAVNPAGPVRHGRSWTEVFGEELTAIGAERPDVVAITAAMLRPTGLLPFSRAFPDRIFDVGLAEQHAVTSAAGLALGGLHPVVAIYATFLNRAFDQALLDVALHRLPVTFVLDRAGITGPDGPSHHGMWDLPVLRVIPGLRVAAPRDATTLRAALREAVDTDGPTAIRFPKAQVGPDIPVIDHIGPIDVLRRDDSRDVLIVAVGTMADTCRELADRLAATGVGCTVVSPSWVLPVPPVLADLAAPYRTVVTVEDGTTAGGTADAVAKLLRDNGITTPLLGFGVPHEFVPHGSRDEVLASCGLSAAALAAKVRGVLTDDAREPLAVHDTHHIGLAPD